MDHNGRDIPNIPGIPIQSLGLYGQLPASSAGLVAAIPAYSFFNIGGRIYSKPVAASAATTHVLPGGIAYPVPVAWQHANPLPAPLMFLNQYQPVAFHPVSGPSAPPPVFATQRPSSSRRPPTRSVQGQNPQEFTPPPAPVQHTHTTAETHDSETKQAEEQVDSGWSWLLEGILQQVLDDLPDADMRHFRQVCHHWREVADQNLEKLSPNCLKSKTILSRFPRLRVLQLINCPNVRNRDLFILSQGKLPLKVLTIGDESNKPWVTNRGLSSIAQMTSIQRLSLHDCNSVTNKGLACLMQMKQLKYLSLRGCKKITNNGLDVLQHLTALTSINLIGCVRISDKALLPLIPLKLQAIQLGLTRIHDEGMSYLAKLTTLQDLHCTNEEMTDAGLRELTTLTRLERLALQDCCEVNGAGLLSLLSHLPRLTHLDLFRNYEFDDEQLASCLPFISSLKSLDLRGTWVTEKGIAQLQVLSQLDTLSLAPHLEMFSDSLCVVSRLTRLTSLTVNGCTYITPSFLRAMRALPQLRMLDLSEEAFSENLTMKEPLQDAVMTCLASLTTLTSLDLSRRSVRLEQLDMLASKLRSLREISICGCPIPSANAVQLQKKYPQLTIIRKDIKHDGFAPDVRVVVTA